MALQLPNLLVIAVSERFLGEIALVQFALLCYTLYGIFRAYVQHIEAPPLTWNLLVYASSTLSGLLNKENQ